MSVQRARVRVHRKIRFLWSLALVYLKQQPSSSYIAICFFTCTALNGVPHFQSSKRTGKLHQADPAGYTQCCHGTPAPRHSPSVKLGHVAQLSPVGLQQKPLGALGWQRAGRARLGEAEAHGARAGEADVAVGEVGGIVHQPAHAQHGVVVQVEDSTWWGTRTS